MNYGLGLAALLTAFGASAENASRPPLLVMQLESKGATDLEATAATQHVVRGLRELDVFSVLSVAASVRSRVSYGGTAPANVARMAAEWRERLP